MLSMASLITNIETLVLDDYMFIDEDSLYALQIFSQDSTSQVTTIPSAKLSVFDLLNFTGSKLGSNYLKLWLSRPLYNIDSIEKRQKTIEILLLSKNSDYISQIDLFLKNMPNMSKLILSLQAGKSNYRTWESIRNFINKALSITQNIYNLDKNEKKSSIDFEESKASNRLIISENVHPKLD
ncbi:uncharacterized protein ASCRUDRAFT_16060, partial [Ascoidea rubescens DSM 1968]